MDFALFLAYAWNPQVGLPLAVVGLIAWLVIWRRSRRAEHDLAEEWGEQAAERREPMLGDAGEHEFELEEADALRPGLRGIAEEDDSLQDELSRLSATLAGDRSAQLDESERGSISLVARHPPSSDAQAIIEALRSPPEPDQAALLFAPTATATSTAGEEIEVEQATIKLAAERTQVVAPAQPADESERHAAEAVSPPLIAAGQISAEIHGEQIPREAASEQIEIVPRQVPPLAVELKAPELIEADNHEPVFIPAPSLAPAPLARQNVGRRPVQLPVERIVTLYVAAPAQKPFQGPDLVVAAEKAGLEFGDMNIYHYLLEGQREQGPVFSVANMLKPGSFDLHQPETIQTPGLSFFMTLPTVLPATAAWDAMLPVAERMAELLRGQILDEERNTLSRQGIAHIRDELKAWDHSHADPQSPAGC